MIHRRISSPRDTVDTVKTSVENRLFSTDRSEDNEWYGVTIQRIEFQLQSGEFYRSRSSDLAAEFL